MYYFYFIFKKAIVKLATGIASEPISSNWDSQGGQNCLWVVKKSCLKKSLKKLCFVNTQNTFF